MSELAEKVDSRYKLFRLQKKVVAICISHNINFLTPTKRSCTTTKINYIKDLIHKLQIGPGGDHGLADNNIPSSIPNINPDYKIVSAGTDGQHAAFIRETLKFEEYM